MCPAARLRLLTSMVRLSLSFLQEAEMVSEVANSKYHSLFFILQTGHKGRSKRSEKVSRVERRKLCRRRKLHSAATDICSHQLHLLLFCFFFSASMSRYHKQKRKESGVTATCAGGMSHSASLTPGKSGIFPSRGSDPPSPLLPPAHQPLPPTPHRL